MKTKHLIQKCIILIYCLLPVCMQGQRIIHVGVDSVACRSDSVRISVGYTAGNEIVVEDLVTSISHPGRVFLPDGIPCGTLGCSYQSPVTFSNFDPSATITSANDINFIRLNIEHSWIGDIYINITCPNGQTASLMNYSDQGTSACNSTIELSHRGWSTGGGGNAPYSTYFGVANDYNAVGDSICDSMAVQNAPGVGWNYCWSDNTVNGYTYGSGDGIIYRAGNQVTLSAMERTIDSSNVATGTHFYHPNESFDSLIGCPINGDWYIEVMDGWSQDNGYIFDWEISLNPALVPEGGTMTSVDIVGDVATRISDSSFLVSAPAGSMDDTSVTYKVVIHSTSGHDIDTSVTVHFSANPYQMIRDSLCVGDTLWVDTMAITSTRQGSDTIYTESGCPFIRDFDVVFSPTYDFFDTAVFCYSEDYVWNGLSFPAPGDYDLQWATTAGCDSVWHITIIGRDSLFVATPLISDDGEKWSSDTLLAGCRPMTVWMKSGTPHAVRSWWNTGDDSTWYESDSMTYIFDSVGIYTLSYMTESLFGCHDTAIKNNTVWVFGRPEAAFIWTPEYPTMSHPTATFINQSTSYTDSTTNVPYPLRYLWTIQTSSDHDSSREESPFFSWGGDGENVFGEFSVLLSASQPYIGPYGDTMLCEDTASANVTIINDWLQFPNMVSPNGDGVNDTWKVVNLLLTDIGTEENPGPNTLYLMNELWIYNKWGMLVYHVKNIASEDDFWDPEKTNSPDGTYYFRFSAKSQFGIVRTNGEIEVVR